MPGVDLSGGGGVNLQSDPQQNQLGQHLAQAALQDPRVQQHLADAAMHHGRETAAIAGQLGAQAAEEFRSYVQEGPAGISILCFLGGCATVVVGVFGLLNFGNAIQTPFNYVLNVYLTCFGLVAVLLEADAERLHTLRVIGKLAPLVQRYQMEVFDRAKFLTQLRGRGFFYLFVGTLAVTQCLVCLLFLCGIWNVLMGVLCLLMSFGFNPADAIPTHAVVLVGYDQQGHPQYAPITTAEQMRMNP